MVDVQAAGEVFSVEVALWLMAIFNGVIAWRFWPVIPEIMSRINERRRDRQSAADRLQDRLEARVVKLEEQRDALEAELLEAHKERDEWRSRAIASEAVMLGEGEAMQKAQRILSTERQADRNKEPK